MFVHGAEFHAMLRYKKVFENDKYIDCSMRIYLLGLPFDNDEFEKLLEMKRL